MSRLALVLVLPLAGCADRPTPSVAPAPAAPKPVVELQPAARDTLRLIAEGQGLGRDWWVRLAVVWRPDPQIDVLIDRTPPGPGDFVTEADGLPCVMAADQKAYLKGARVEWVEKADGAYFDVTFPNRDPADRDRASGWLRAEAARRKGK